MTDFSLPQAFLFGGTGHGELILIFVVILLLFGPRKLPEMARMIGRILSQLRNASNDFRDQVMSIEEEDLDAAPRSEEAKEPVSVEATEIASEDVDNKEDPDSDGRLAG